MLDLYGRESYEQEQIRVRLAILKLSEGNLDNLRLLVESAKRDYRDVLAWAEYPNAMTSLPLLPPRLSRDKDLKQYQVWLQSGEAKDS